MKIGILGNMNNMYFSLARYLADEGYDCDLLVFDDEPDHFHPTADSFTVPANLVVKQVNWGDAAQFIKKRRQAEASIKSYSFLIGSGTAPAFVHAAGAVLDLFVPYGHDLYRFPFGHLVHPVRQLSYWTMAWHQLRGIRQCPHIMFDKATPAFDRVFRRLKYTGERIVSPVPLFYGKEYEANREKIWQANPYFSILQQLRSENDLLILQHIRQFWRWHPDHWHMKGNDCLIEGYARFVAAHPSCKTKLLLFEYGLDVAQTKRLIDRYNLNAYVLWFPKALRKNLMLFIQLSDVVVGELHHAWNTYCVALETLASAKPLMHNRNDAYLADAYPDLYPMLQASSADDVYNGLKTVWKNKEAMHKMGEEGKAWFDEYCVKKPIQHIIRLIQEKQKRLHGQAPC